MKVPWKPEYGVMIPSVASDLKEGQWVCPGSMKEGPMLRQAPNPLDPGAPCHEYRGAPQPVPCGSKRFVLAFYHDPDRSELFVRCDSCGSPYSIVQVKK